MAIRKVDFDLCKNGVGHAWDQIPATSRPSFGVYMVFRCERCTTVRWDIIDPATGELRSSSYQHPDGYSEIPKTTKQEWRMSHIRKKVKKTA